MKNIIQKFRIDNRIRVGYGSAFFLLLVSYLLTLFANRNLLDQAKRVDHTNRVITDMENMMSEVKDAEVGFRGYIVMKDTFFLQPYFDNKDEILATLRILKAETSDNPFQIENLEQTTKLVNDKLEIIERVIKTYPENDFQLTDSIKRDMFRSKLIMDRLRYLTKSMQAHEHVLLSKRSEGLASRYSSLNTFIVVSLVLALLLFIFGLLTYMRENKARRQADFKIEDYQKELESRIRDLDKANKELIQMRSQEKFATTGRIARTIAHEVRNPLTNINLAVDQLKTDLGNKTSEHPVLFDMITRNGQRINQLITELLDSTKFIELKYNKASINSLLDEALELARDRIALNKITVIKKYSDDMCEVSVDSDKIRIAFLNLIVNAVEAMEPGKGILEIVTKGLNDKCVVEIRDNGSGMDGESMTKLFEPYFTSKAKGTGLGLTNTQNIILSHRGNIAVDSEKGKGTTFTVTLDFAK